MYKKEDFLKNLNGFKKKIGLSFLSFVLGVGATIIYNSKMIMNNYQKILDKKKKKKKKIK